MAHIISSILIIIMISIDEENAYFGTGPYFSLRKGIVMKNNSTQGRGLFAIEFIPKGSILWKNRSTTSY